MDGKGFLSSLALTGLKTLAPLGIDALGGLAKEKIKGLGINVESKHRNKKLSATKEKSNMAPVMFGQMPVPQEGGVYNKYHAHLKHYEHVLGESKKQAKADYKMYKEGAEKGHPEHVSYLDERAKEAKMKQGLSEYQNWATEIRKTSAYENKPKGERRAYLSMLWKQHKEHKKGIKAEIKPHRRGKGLEDMGAGLYMP